MSVQKYEAMQDEAVAVVQDIQNILDLLSGAKAPRQYSNVGDMVHTASWHLARKVERLMERVNTLHEAGVDVAPHSKFTLCELNEVGYDFHPNNNTYGPYTDGRTYAEGSVYRVRDIRYLGGVRFGVWYEASLFQKGDEAPVVTLHERVQRALPE